MGVKDKIVERVLGSSGKFSDKQVGQTLDLLLEHGVERGASSLHIEPHERFDAVRYRINNTLHGMHKLPRAAHAALMQQIKKRSHMDTRSTDVVQEGGFSLTINGQQINVEASVAPVFGGEKAVLHLNPSQSSAKSLEELGFWGESLALLRQALAQPHGLITVSGPRRSGITTTLHSLLDILNTPMISIATVETHPPRHIPGASQLQPSRHDSPASQLHKLLSHDANIIMIDRVTDSPTAQKSVDAAQRGHLMIDGLYAEDAASSLAQVRAFGVEPFLLAHTLRASIAQQLARRLCPECRERHALTAKERQELQAMLGVNNSKHRARVHKLEQEALEFGIGDPEMSSTPTAISHIWKAKNGGCAECHHTGYQGVVALTEVIVPSEDFRRLLNRNTPPTAADLRKEALQQDYIPLALDALVKSLRGLTTIEEVVRVLSILNKG